MADQANITAYDGAATPVSHNLKATLRTSNGTDQVCGWRENLETVPEGAQISMTLARKRLKSGVFEVTQTVMVPVMEAISGQNAAGYTAPPAVAYVDKVVVITYQHQRSTPTSRRIARQLAMNLANGVNTSVTPVTNQPVPDAIDYGIMPT
jgi:hypothetical protein